MFQVCDVYDVKTNIKTDTSAYLTVSVCADNAVNAISAAQRATYKNKNITEDNIIGVSLSRRGPILTSYYSTSLYDLDKGCNNKIEAEENSLNSNN